VGKRGFGSISKVLWQERDRRRGKRLYAENFVADAMYDIFGAYF
jgi:hypothetical protein